MAQRLLVVAHAATPATRALIFGESGGLLQGEIGRLSGRTACWVSGPEEACQTTAVRLGGTAEAIRDLRDCDFGAWTGSALVDVASRDPSGLDAWLRDPNADGRSVAVVTALVARALLVHALGAAPEVIFRIDIAPLGRALISRSQQTWRLTSLEPVNDRM